ncbi:MAG: PilZ domain-containing protein [Rubinisphaera brasiliensis]|uniref:PilZ domain-containing protein n=1 Tax=Rubinisphaera brasiliensis TaxID=119 RepID=UPI00391C9EB8
MSFLGVNRSQRANIGQLTADSQGLRVMPTLTEAEIETRAQRVLAMLQSWSDRFMNHFTHRREHIRRGCVLKSSCITPGQNRTESSTDGKKTAPIWIRNISSTGIGFISYGPLRPEKDLIVIKLGPKNMLCEIVRTRQVHDGFWEYGSKFLRSVEDIDEPATSAKFDTTDDQQSE